ncbi:uncharacterized protein LOC129582887 [Paramacrobiotus metropolitanus]|uniref:uncharacterized protein LOC129582887 n=1 Tax=Paramacrobiotus metropolitanus TaxID=2943436 RepID=UPI0024461F17|nr:uncharacterized protein LOC129582887 [Paramacrobiotus metropolitanus]
MWHRGDQQIIYNILVPIWPYYFPNMEERRRSLSTISGVHLKDSSSSTAQLTSQWIPEIEKAKTTRFLDRILRFNLHRFIIALYLLAVGIALCVIVFTNDPDHKLRDFYGTHDLISVPLTGLVIAGLWVKVYICVRHMRSAITTYRTAFAQDPTIVFTGMNVSHCKRTLIKVVCTAVIGVKIAFVITMCVCLKKAVTRLPGTSMDTTVVVLFALVVAGAVATLLTMIEASFTIILLTRPRRVPFAGRLYPLLIYESASDEKPVLLS